MIKKHIFYTTLLIILLYLFYNVSNAADDKSIYLKEPTLIRATYYTDKGLTSSGQKVRYGIIASMPEWEGCVAALYSEDDFIGYFEILDTGGEPIKEGNVIDIWLPDDEAGREWISKYGDYVYMVVIPGEG